MGSMPDAHLANLSQDVEATHVGESQVENDQIRVAGIDTREQRIVLDRLDRRGDDVFKHFPVIHQHRIDFDPPHRVFAVHGDLDHAATSLPGDFHARQFLLGLLHFLLHL